MTHPADHQVPPPGQPAAPAGHPMSADGYGPAPDTQAQWGTGAWTPPPAEHQQQGQHMPPAEQYQPGPEHQMPPTGQYGSGPQVPQPEHYPTGAAVNPFERGFPRNGSLSQMLKFAALAATVLGLVIPFDSSMPYQTQIAWSIFATLAAAAQLLGAGSPGPKAQQNWWNGVLATGALSLYWLLVVVPMVTSNSGFVLTLATAAAWAGVAFSPARSWS